MLCDLFLMKKLLKSVICGTREWCMDALFAVDLSTITSWTKKKMQNANTKLIWIQIFKKKKKKSISIKKKKFIRLKKASAHSIPMGLISKTQAPKQSSYSTISQQLPVNHNRKSVEPQWNPTAYILLTQKKIILTHLPSNAFNTSRTQ